MTAYTFFLNHNLVIPILIQAALHYKAFYIVSATTYVVC